MFTIKTTGTTTTVSTTTYKAKSLADLLNHRPGGAKQLEPTNPPTTTSTTTTRRPFKPRDKLRPKRPQKESGGEKEHLASGRKVSETNRISESYTDRFRLKTESVIAKDDVTRFLPSDYNKPRSSPNLEDGLLRELLSSLKEKDLDKLIPNRSTAAPVPGRFTPRRTTRRPARPTAVTEDDISQFLPPDYKSSTSRPPRLGITDLFKNVEISQAELPAGLLPADYPLDKLAPKLNIKQEPLPESLLPKGFKKLKIEQEEVPASLLPTGFKLPEPAEVPASLLPSDYKPQLEVKEAPASLLPDGFKLPEPEEIDPSLLPPGYKPEPAGEIDPALLPPGYKAGQEATPPPEQKGGVTPKLIKFNFW